MFRWSTQQDKEKVERETEISPAAFYPQELVKDMRIRSLTPCLIL